MYKDYRYINAGQNEIYRWGHKAQDKVLECKKEHNGYFSIQTDMGPYWTLGTSTGKYGDFINYKGTIFSVNSGGFAYAKAGTEKGEKFLEMLDSMVSYMQDLKSGNRKVNDDIEDDEDFVD